jgi:hypothetical protein
MSPQKFKLSVQRRLPSNGGKGFKFNLVHCYRDLVLQGYDFNNSWI